MMRSIGCKCSAPELCVFVRVLTIPLKITFRTRFLRPKTRPLFLLSSPVASFYSPPPLLCKLALLFLFPRSKRPRSRSGNVITDNTQFDVLSSSPPTTKPFPFRSSPCPNTIGQTIGERDLTASGTMISTRHYTLLRVITSSLPPRTSEISQIKYGTPRFRQNQAKAILNQSRRTLSLTS